MRTIPDFDSASPWGRHAPSAWQGRLIAACHAVPPYLRRLILLIRRPIKYGSGQPLDVTVWGYRVRLMPRGNLSEAKLLFAPHLFDPEEFALLRRHLAGGDNFIDIGANAGVYSLWARRWVGEAGRVLAVEPDPEMRRRIEFNLGTNALANIELCALALSDRQGEAELMIKPGQRGENTLAQAEADRAGGERVLLRVPLDTLHHLLDSRGMKTLRALKIDIEGHEPPVLSHFFAHAPESLWPTLAITERKIDTEAAIRALFETHGYRCVLVNKLNLAFERVPHA
jgi:FkbM family methyltransferase